jgi:hypothetical protein
MEEIQKAKGMASSPMHCDPKELTPYEMEIIRLKDIAVTTAYRADTVYYYIFNEEEKPSVQVVSDRHIDMIDDIRDAIFTIEAACAKLDHIADCVAGKMGNYRL